MQFRLRLLVISAFVTVCGSELSSGYGHTTPIDSYNAPIASVGPLPPSPDKAPSPETSSRKNVSLNVSEKELTTSLSDTSSTDYLYDDENHPYGYGQNVLQKNIYVHLPPLQMDQHVPTVHQAPPRVHYKIIFIRSPSVTTASPVVPVAPKIEERTVVYVLVEKPQEPDEIVIPTQPPTEPSKPEVYFIKYKAQNKSDKSDIHKNSYSSNENGNSTNSKGDSSKYGVSEKEVTSDNAV